MYAAALTRLTDDGTAKQYDLTMLTDDGQLYQELSEIGSRIAAQFFVKRINRIMIKTIYGKRKEESP